MKSHNKTILSIVLLALLMSVSGAWANPGRGGPGMGDPNTTPRPGRGGHLGCRGRGCVPEIDAAGALPALALLGGVAALIRERKRHK